MNWRWHDACSCMRGQLLQCNNLELCASYNEMGRFIKHLSRTARFGICNKPEMIQALNIF